MKEIITYNIPMHRFYPKFFLSALLTKLPSRRRGQLLCQKCTKITFSGYESMQRDIRQENRIRERQKMYLKFLKKYVDTKTVEF
jgi:hypothetical protein